MLGLKLLTQMIILKQAYNVSIHFHLGHVFKQGLNMRLFYKFRNIACEDTTLRVRMQIRLMSFILKRWESYFREECNGSIPLHTLRNPKQFWESKIPHLTN